MEFSVVAHVCITVMVYGNTPYVGMVPKKNGGHSKFEFMTILCEQ